MDSLHLTDFPLRSHDKLRYADTDRQGHINNAVFATFLETGRVEMLYHPGYTIMEPGNSFVIASLKLNFQREITWPGQVDIGTGILKIGNSSVRLYQKLFQHEMCVAEAETTIVQVSDSDGKAAVLSNQAKETLAQWHISP